jgi:hypothetical protein
MRFCFLFSCSFLPIALLHADEVSLGNQGKITGSVKSISAEKEIRMQTPLSPDLLVLQGDQLESILFEKKEDATSSSNNIVYLKNGDVIPADVESLDGKTLTFQTAWSSKLQVDRQAIDCIHFGTGENQILYRGPNKDEWNLNSSWKFDDALISEGWGAVHRKFDTMPDRYILNFDVEWENNVGFKCFFNSTTQDGNRPTDGYFIQFNTAGFELKRQSTGTKKYTTLAAFNDFTPENMEDNVMKIEIRVDRSNRLLQLLVNDKQLRNNIIDPMETGPIPDGKIVSFISTSGKDDPQTISNISLTTWGAAGTEARLEKRTDTKRDVLFDVESNRSSGTLKSIQPGKELQVLFENPHDPSPKPLAASKVAVIYFSGDKPKAEASPCIIKLHGQGALHVNSFTLADSAIVANHPSLGEIRIAVAMIESITRTP